MEMTKKITLENKDQKINHQNKYDKCKNILQNLFKQTFEPILSKMESKTNEHFVALSQTFNLTKMITDLSTKISINIQQSSTKKIFNKNKTKPIITRKKTKTNMGFNTPSKLNNKKIIFNRSQTSFANEKSKIKAFFSKTQTSFRSKDQKTSRDNRKSLKANSFIIKKKRKFTQNNENIISNKENLDIQRYDISRKLSIDEDNNHFYTKTKKIPYSKLPRTRNNGGIKLHGTYNKITKNSINNTIINYYNLTNSSSLNNVNFTCNILKTSILKKRNDKKRNEKYLIRKTNSKIPLKIPKINNLHNTSDNISKSTRLPQKLQIDGKKNMSTMESNLQKYDLTINYDDPLLIAPLSDLNFNNNINHFKPNKTNLISRENFLKIFLNLSINDKTYSLFKYLTFTELIDLRIISKQFNKLISKIIINDLEQKKNCFDLKLKKLSLIPETRQNFDDFNYSKGSKKSIELLNEELLNKLFQEETVPNKDILFIYKVFFQLINNPIVKLKDMNEFWKNCRLYFLHSAKGKTGKLMEEIIINKKINVSGKNLYRIYKLTNNKLNKINPGYFSKICGTTGLFSFFIKDILEYLGFSENGNIKRNGYLTFKKISEFLGIIVNDAQKKLSKYIL